MFGIEEFKLINVLKDNKWFIEIVCIITSIFTFVLWNVGTEVALTFLLTMFGLFLLIFNDIKYTIPFLINSLFSISPNSVGNIVGVVLSGVFCLCVLILYFIKNKFKFDIKGHGLVVLLIGVFTFLPIFWSRQIGTIVPETKLLYFSGIAYFIIYILYKNIKTRITPILFQSMCYVPLIILLQLLVIVPQNPNFPDNVTHVAVHLGWAGSNHAGMMILFSIPFILYRLFSKENKSLSIVMFIVSILAVIVTFSRGIYLFLGIELGLFAIYLIYLFRKKVLTYVLSAVVLIIGCTFLLSSDLIEKVFDIGLSMNGREPIYTSAFELFFQTNGGYFLFGSGIVSGVHSEFQDPHRVLFYHNTICQLMVTGGLSLLIVFIIHAWQKYIPLIKKRNMFNCILFIGFLSLDLYGMIDNTYFTYYFMIPYVLLLICLDKEFVTSELDYNMFSSNQLELNNNI